MFASFSFAPKTTQMGKQSSCDLELNMIEYDSNSFAIPPETFLVDQLNLKVPEDFNLNHDLSNDLANISAYQDTQNDLDDDIQKFKRKELPFLHFQQYKKQLFFTPNISDLNILEESFLVLPANSAQLLQDLLFKKLSDDAVYFTDFYYDEKFDKIESVIKEDHQLQNINISPKILAMPDIEENLFCDCSENSMEIPIQIGQAKINFELEKKATVSLLQREIPILSFPQRTNHHNEFFSQLQKNQFQINQSKIMDTTSTQTVEHQSPAKKTKIQPLTSSQPSENSNPKNDFQIMTPSFKIPRKLPSKSDKDKNSESQRVSESLLKNPKNDTKSFSKSRLFPKASKSVTPIKTSSDTRKALIIDERLISLPGFQRVFADYRVIFRTLKYYDIEINEHICVIFRPILGTSDDITSKNKKNYHVSMDQLAKALTLFEKVFIIISMEDEMKQYKFLTKDISKLISHVYGNQIPVKIRQFPTYKSAFNFIHSIVDDSQIFLRDCESLHEHLLSLFPSISKSLAQAILRKGNPIVDCSIPLDEFPQMNIIPFKRVLDTLSESYQQNKMKKQIMARDDDDEKLSYAFETSSHPLFAPSNKKINAPIPSSIYISDE